MPGPEAQVQSAIYDYLLYVGFLVMRINQGGMKVERERSHYYTFAKWMYLGSDEEKGGISDILALDPSGTLWAIEVKSPKRKRQVTPQQKKFLRAVDARNGVALVAWTVAQVQSHVEKRQHLWQNQSNL